jgi:hypothetical protein
MTSQSAALRNHTIPHGLLACVVIATRSVQACTRKAAGSNWWLLLSVGAGMLLTVVALKLVALFGAAVHVSFLRDVGQNVGLPAVIGAGGAALGGGAGGKGGGPLGFMQWVPYLGNQDPFLHSEPSTDSPRTMEPPIGGRYTYNDVRYDASGNPTWYHMTPFGTDGGWAPASDLSSTRQVEPPQPPAPKLDSGKIVSGSGAAGGARG